MATNCVHEWSDWKKMLWYTQEGRLVGEMRKCLRCTTVETRNVEMETRPAVLQPTVSVYPGIFEEEGKLLLVRRSLDIKSSPGEWEPPGGGISAQIASGLPDERLILQELQRMVRERTGIDLSSFLVPMIGQELYPAILKGGGDWALATVIGIVKEKPTLGETMYVSPLEFRQLAEGPEKNRLVSGWGNRMCRICLRLFIGFNGPNKNYPAEAWSMLGEIWNKRLVS